jgi:uncharacterized protein YbjT (DUF2867 family)
MILVAGASGYIGRCLVRELLRRGRPVCSLTRRAERAPEGAQVVCGDLLDYVTVRDAMHGVDTAYYLVHNMGPQPLGRGRPFPALERDSIRNFLRACQERGVRRVIYLGGLGSGPTAVSEHLRSRWHVEESIINSGLEYTIFRAGIVAGQGCPAFDSMLALAAKLPWILLPRWGRSRVQPIALVDMIGYLTDALDCQEAIGQTFDVGGPEVLTYREMMERVGEVMGRQPRFSELPLWLFWESGLVVSVACKLPMRMAYPLVSSMKIDMVCTNDRVRAVMPRKLASFREAISQALREA